MRTAHDSAWDLEAIRRRLGTRALGVDLDAMLARWRAEGRTGDDRAFIDWVLATVAEEQVMVTAILPPRLAAAVPTVSSDPTLILAEPAPVASTGDAVTVLEGSVSHRRPAIPGAETPRPSEEPGSPAGPASHARYVIVGEAGKGGMAVVHVARDVELIRKVALKRLAGSAAAHHDAQARFLREVQISAQLDHPNIVPVYGLEVGPDGVPAYAMKLVEGQTLDQYLRETRAFYERGEQPDEAHALHTRLEHFLKVCDAMAYAHDKGVVHRDLKPANVMIGRHNEIYVMDWGICRVLRLPEPDAGGVEDPDEALAADADTRTRMGAIVGTARYMSPEQAQGRSDLVGPASDQCALGLMLYEIVTLQAPFEGRTVVDVLARAARGEVRPVRHAFKSGSVPAELAAIVGRATAVDPSARYRDLRAFAADIRRHLRGDAVEARPDTPWQKAQRYVARHRQFVLLLVIGLVAASALGTAGLLYRHERALEAADARERAMLAFVDRVASVGDALQTGLLELAGELDSVASAATLALQYAAPDPGRFYWIDDFDSPATRPPDMTAGAGDEPPRSFVFGAWVAAPGVNRQAFVPSIRRLLRSRSYRGEIFERARAVLGTAGGAGRPSDGDLEDSGVESFVIGLAGGVAMRLPGHAGLPRGVDPREEAWYRLAAGQQGVRWGEPYEDPDEHRLFVPVSQALRADDGRELGVVSLLLGLDRIVENLPAGSGEIVARATLLLDPQGRVIGSDGLLDPQGDSMAGTVRLQPFPDPALIEAIARADTGYIVTTAFGQPDIAAFDTIHPLGWVLVRVADEARVLSGGSGD